MQSNVKMSTDSSIESANEIDNFADNLTQFQTSGLECQCRGSMLGQDTAR